MFQSAPGGEAGGNGSAVGLGVEGQGFQSAPGGEAGGNKRRIEARRNGSCFNPPPAVRPGET